MKDEQMVEDVRNRLLEIERVAGKQFSRSAQVKVAVIARAAISALECCTAQEPEVPKQIKDLIFDAGDPMDTTSINGSNRRVVEAYQRGCAELFAGDVRIVPLGAFETAVYVGRVKKGLFRDQHDAELFADALREQREGA